MCGIAGLVSLAGSLSPQTLHRLADGMQRVMSYRGPDDSGIWVSPDGRCAFSHRRLAIIDPTPDGHQPMVSENGATAITFNGELYNYRTLRERMLREGHVFRSRSDTEVLLRGLDVRGIDILPELDGMYAFGHYDSQTGRLTLARDNFGEKPLYYSLTDSYFAFASELHALAGLPGFDHRIESWQIASYLSFQYVPAPHTIYRGAKKLLPGHFLKLACDGAVTTGRHFDFRASPARASTRPITDFADELEELLVEAVRDSLVSDVPIGAFLSGGVDSSTVVAIATKRLGRRLKTFSIGFANTPDSEHETAREVARIIGSDHHDRVLAPDIVTSAGEIARALDEPNGDSSCLPTLLLSRLAREQVTVAVSGDGGDEMFGGYGRYFELVYDMSCRPGNPRMVNWRPGRAYYSPRILLFPDRDLEALLGSIPPVDLDILDALRAEINHSPLPIGNILREMDVRNYLPGAVLAKVDRMSMQTSLEVRAPLLTRRIATFAMGLAEGDCFVRAEGRPGHGKRVLKEVARRYIPGEIIDRPKMGFGLPMSRWGLDPLLAALSDKLRQPEARLPAWIPRRQLDDFLARQRQTPIIYQLWGLLILELWLQHHPAEPA